MHDPRRASYLFTAALAAGLSAQGTIHAVSAGITVQAGLAAPATVAPGVNVTAGTLRSAANSTGSGLFRAEHTQSTTAIELAWTLAATAQNSGQVTSLGEIRYELSTPEQVEGDLTVTWVPTCTGSGTAAFSVDLFDDGLDLITTTTTFAVTLGPWPLPLRVRAQVGAAAGTIAGPWNTTWRYSGAANGALQIRFQPTHCTATALAAGCAEPQLQVLGNLRGGADLRGSFAPAIELGIVVLGLDQQAGMLPWAPGCPLVTTPVVTLWGLPDAQRAASWSIGLPASVRPAGFAAQLVGLDVDALAATTSAGFWVTCR